MHGLISFKETTNYHHLRMAKTKFKTNHALIVDNFSQKYLKF